MTDQNNNSNTTETEKHFEEHHPAVRPKNLSLADIRDGCITLTDDNKQETRVCVVNEELKQGISIMEEFDTTISILGSARTKENHPDYISARELGKRIATELGYGVVTGGGPGIMEAGNRGAFEAGGKSIGITIKLPFEQKTSPYVNVEIPFYYFFTRKVTLMYSAEAYVYYPGGFGTLDELFELLTLMQTNKVAKAPVVLVGKSYWEPLDAVIKKMMREDRQTISPEDLDLYVITDDLDEVMEICKNAPVRVHG